MLPKEIGLKVGDPKLQKAAQKLKEFYFKDGASQKAYMKAQGTLIFGYGVSKTVRTLANDPKKTTPNYLYVFNHEKKTPTMCKLMFNVTSVPGVCHGDDGEFLFHINLPMLPNTAPIQPGTADDKVLQNSVNWITDFAKTGTVDPKWPTAEASKSWPYVEIAEGLTPKTGFLAGEDLLWDSIYEELRA